MAQPTLYVAITNHGFGHATRTASVVAAIQRQFPDLLIILTTTAPHWLLASYIPGDFIYRPRSFDIGVIQADSLTMDKSATLAHLQQICDRKSEIIASEVNFIQQNGVSLILGDIPPLVSLIAKASGVPCWMLGNFGWDFIYRAWGEDFLEIADWIGECFSQCNHLFRLPFHEPMSAFPKIEDIGFVGGSPHHDLLSLQQTFNLTAPREKTVLITFGGLNLQKIPYHGLQNYPDWQFISFDHQAPELPNLCIVRDRQYRPVDFMPLSGCVISKPGYGTFAEACRTGTPVISLERDDFAEASLLINGICRYTHHKILPPAKFYEGTWEFLKAPLNPPTAPESSVEDGNSRVAEAVGDFFA